MRHVCLLQPRTCACWTFCDAPRAVPSTISTSPLYQHTSLSLQLVPILPVVTKADTMTVKECVSYRREISQKMQMPSAPIDTFLFTQETLEVRSSDPKLRVRP